MFDPLLPGNSIIKWHFDNQLAVSHVRVQKLLYYCHGNFLGYSKRPMNTQVLEAWEKGPVSPRLYTALSAQQPQAFGQIRSLATIPDLGPRNSSIIASLSDYSELPWARYANAVIDAVCREFESWTDDALIDQTHKEHPWKDAYFSFVNTFNRKPTDTDGPSISNTEIFKYFSEIQESLHGSVETEGNSNVSTNNFSRGTGSELDPDGKQRRKPT